MVFFFDVHTFTSTSSSSSSLSFLSFLSLSLSDSSSELIIWDLYFLKFQIIIYTIAGGFYKLDFLKIENYLLCIKSLSSTSSLLISCSKSLISFYTFPTTELAYVYYWFN